MLTLIFLIPKFAWLTFIDFIRWCKNPKFLPKGGVWIFVGLYGAGKTLSMVREAYMLHVKYNQPVYSNMGLEWQTGSLSSWKDLLTLPEGAVVLIDELGTLVDNYKFKDMPENLFTLLMQNRKLRIRIMSTVQVFDDAVKKFRTLSKWIIECRMFGRMVQNKYYTQYQYSRGDTVKRKSMAKYYLAEDKFFDLYDTREIIKKMQKE